MLNEKVERGHLRDTHTYPCGCSTVYTFKEAGNETYDHKDMFSACRKHENPIMFPEHAKRLINAEVASIFNSLENDIIIRVNMPILWEAFIDSIIDPIFRANVRSRLKTVVESERAKEKKEAEKAHQREIEAHEQEIRVANELLVEYTALVEASKKDRSLRIPSYEKFVFSKKQKK